MTVNAGVVALARRLIRIDSANPDLRPGARGEGEVAGYVAEWLARRGFETTRLEKTPGRPSIVGVHRGSGGGQSLLLNGHLDTVSLATYAGDPLDPVVDDGRLYGRGSYDMKAGLAAMMCAAATASASEHRGDIILALVADEECGSAGTAELLAHGITADAAIVCEPTEEELVIAHRGFAWFDVTVHGRAAHGSRRDLGLDAIAKSGRFLTALDAYDRDLAARTPHPLLGTANVHASVIRGGEEASSYPADCTITLERRTLPGESASGVAAELSRLLASALTHDPDVTATITPGLCRSPLEVDPATPIVRTLASAHRAQSGTDVVVRGEAFWTDAALLAEAGIPAVLYGPRGGGAHAASEWVEIASLTRVTAVLTSALAGFVG